PAPAPAPAPAPEPGKPAEVPEGLLGFSASSDFSVGVWNLKAGSAQYLRGHGGEVQGVALSPDGSLVATSSKDKTVRLWTTKDLKPAQVFTVEGSCSVLRFTADGKTLVVGLDETGVLLSIDVASAVITRLEGHTGGVMGMALASDGRLFTVARDRTLRAWDLAAGKPTGLKVDLPAEPFSVAVWDEGQRVLVTGREPVLRAFNVADGKEAATLPLPDPMHSGLAVNGKAGLLYVGTEGGVQVVDLAALAIKGKWAGPAKAVMSLALTADGAWLLGGDEESGLWLWGTAAGTVGWSRTGAHTAAVNAVVLSR
ncbi:MAG: WD40 repeat domain-containing protein, partial [Planctomycetia bacterium]